MIESEVLKEALARLNISQSEFAGITGVSRVAVSNWVNGKSSIPAAVFVTLVDVDNQNHKRITENLSSMREDMAERLKVGIDGAVRRGRPSKKEISHSSRWLSLRSGCKIPFPDFFSCYSGIFLVILKNFLVIPEFFLLFVTQIRCTSPEMNSEKNSLSVENFSCYFLVIRIFRKYFEATGKYRQKKRTYNIGLS